MSFFTVISELFAAMGTAVSKRVSVIALTRPLSQSIRNEKKQMRKRYYQLGELYYQKHAGLPSDPELDYLVNDLHTSKARIEEFTAEIKSARQPGLSAPKTVKEEPSAEAEA